MIQHGIVLLLLGPILPDIMESFGVSESRAGIMLGLGSLGFMLGPPLSGMVSDRRGVGLALGVGFVLELVALTGMLWVPVFGLVMAYGFLTRFGASFVETGANVLPTLAAAERRGALMNLVHTFFGIGALLSPMVAGWILRSTGSWRPVFWFPVAATGVLLMATAMTPLPRAMPRARRSPVKAVLSPAVLLGGLTLFLYVGAEVGVSSWIVLYMRRGLGFSTIVATSGLTVLWLGIMVGRFVNSLLATRIGSTALVIGAGVGGLLLGEVLMLPRGPVGMYLILALFGLVISGVFPHVMAEINGLFPGRAGAVTAVLTIAASSGAMVIHPVLGLTAEVWGLRTALSLPGLLMGLSAVRYWICVVLLKRNSGRPEVSEAG
jgi:fucose permease